MQTGTNFTERAGEYRSIFFFEGEGYSEGSVDRVGGSTQALFNLSRLRFVHRPTRCGFQVRLAERPQDMSLAEYMYRNRTN